jgi:hypothetical protein
MTQYESLSLSLLCTIANGISLMLSQPPEHDESRRRRHDELVRAFRKGTEEMVDVVTAALQSHETGTDGPASEKEGGPR